MQCATVVCYCCIQWLMPRILRQSLLLFVFQPINKTLQWAIVRTQCCVQYSCVSSTSLRSGSFTSYWNWCLRPKKWSSITCGRIWQILFNCKWHSKLLNNCWICSMETALRRTSSLKTSCCWLFSHLASSTRSSSLIKRKLETTAHSSFTQWTFFKQKKLKNCSVLPPLQRSSQPHQESLSKK